MDLVITRGMIITMSQVEKGSKPFRFYNSWTELMEDPKFMELAREGISKNFRGPRLFKLKQKLKVMKGMGIREGKLHQTSGKIQGFFEYDNRNTRNRPSSVPLQQRCIIIGKHTYLKQRIKVSWLILGDTDTIFQHCNKDEES